MQSPQKKGGGCLAVGCAVLAVVGLALGVASILGVNLLVLKGVKQALTTHVGQADWEMATTRGAPLGLLLGRPVDLTAKARMVTLKDGSSMPEIGLSATGLVLDVKAGRLRELTDFNFELGLDGPAVTRVVRQQEARDSVFSKADISVVDGHLELTYDSPIPALGLRAKVTVSARPRVGTPTLLTFDILGVKVDAAGLSVPGPSNSLEASLRGQLRNALRHDLRGQGLTLQSVAVEGNLLKVRGQFDRQKILGAS